MDRRLWAAALSACLGWLAGCALTANPQPPTLWLPTPVKDLTAVRAGGEVHLHWTMPRETTDKVALKGPQRAHFCWSWVQSAGKKTAAADCKAAGDGTFVPVKPADTSLPLPTELTSGPTRAVEFFVELENHAGKTAGPSNPALMATGVAPPAVTGLGATAQAEGVVLHWDKAAPQPGLVLRIHRDLVKAASPAKPNKTLGAALPEQQTLEVNLDKEDPGEALDRDATLDRTWRYTAERVLHVEADRYALEIGGNPSAAVTIDAKDVFPPQVPRGLAAVVDAQAHAVDLSWMPDAEADLAGYVVYRRDVTAGGNAERISGAKPVVAPAYSDTTVVPGHRYAYSVSAVDRDGNESARSEEVQEELPE
ncbi:MAG: fibronectin type III domain-containing protein [Acidobacteriaceae bacterium]